MKKVMVIVLCIISASLFTGCGGGEQGCVDQCTSSLSQSTTLCGAQHGRLSRAGNECAKVALQENDKCSAKCYGL